MAKFCILIAYDGTDYVGWQRQPSGVSIQGLLEDTLALLDAREVAVAGAGRTDAGVHALGQTASFSLTRAIDASTIVRALNAHLPADVRVRAAVDVPEGFHARFDARSKRYRYRIWNGAVVSPFERRFVWHIPGPLDVEAMTAAATLVEGRRDFAAFQSTGGDAATTIRTIHASRIHRVAAESESGDARGGRLIDYEISGDGFLRHMVRAIAGSLVEVGQGRRRPEWLLDVMASGDRSACGRSAPASGLFLVSVGYDRDVFCNPLETL